MYELNKPQIDAWVDKGRTQATSVYDKHMHKVCRRGLLQQCLVMEQS